MGWKQFAEIGLKIAGPTVLGGVDLSGLLNKTKAKKHAHRDDPERGHDYVAVAIREALQAAYPAAIEALDRIAVVWATVALQELRRARRKAGATKAQAAQADDQEEVTRLPGGSVRR